MNKSILLPSLFTILLTIGACTTTPSKSIEELVADGGEVIEFMDLIGKSGVTFVALNDGWFNYLGPDGRKVVKINKTGEIKHLAWRVNEDDHFCQQMFATEIESCDDHVVIKAKDGTYVSYNKSGNKSRFPFTIVAGNPQGF